MGFIYFNKPLLIQKRKSKIFKIFKNRIKFQSASDLTLDRRNHRPIFQRVIQTQKKHLLPIFVFTIGVKCKTESDNRCWIGFLIGVSNKCKYDTRTHTHTHTHTHMHARTHARTDTHIHTHTHAHTHARTHSSNVEGNKLPKDLTPQHMIRTRDLLVEPDGQKWTNDPPPPPNTAFIQVQKKAIKRLRGKLFVISKNM